MTKAYDYCKKNVNKKTTPIYVKKQMREFMRIEEGKDKKYKVEEFLYQRVEGVLKLLIMASGPKTGETLYECTVGYQWLVYTATLCVVHRDNPQKRRYEQCILEICRKNFKTYTVAVLFLILMITEPRFSNFFSVAPDGTIAKEIREALEKTILSSPDIFEYNGEERFDILRDSVKFKPNGNTCKFLNFSTNRMDSRSVTGFCADEVGALPTSYPVEAMKSGQVYAKNRIGFIISTKYNTLDNPFEDYVDFAKKILDKTIDNEKVFALLYEPDNTKDWETDDNILKQANPVALELPSTWEFLLEQRAEAIAVERKRENFVTKHCNIIYQGAGTETYIDTKDVQLCRTDKIDWQGRVVYLGLDLSATNDNTSVAMVSVDDDGKTILADVVAFLPEGRIEEKMSFEKVDYREHIRNHTAIACGDRIIDYAVVEDYILGIEEKYGVQVQAIAYDRYNALSTAQKLENVGHICIEVRQHSSVLHPPTKLIKEKILSKEFKYTNNKLLEINFQNARVSYDTNENMYVTKKKSKGKVDMVVSLINAVYLLQQDYFFSENDAPLAQML